MRKSLPKKTFATRIENKHGGGIPDVHVVWNGIPFWVELKVASGTRIKLTPNQVAWNAAYWARGGLNFILVKDPVSKLLLLFDGCHGSEALDAGIKSGCCSRYGSFDELFLALRPRMVDRLCGNLAASNQVLRLPARNPPTKTTCIRAAGVGGFKK